MGLAIRELLAPWTGDPYDFEVWTRLGFFMQSLRNPYGILPYVRGLSFSPFATTGSISYPPFSAFIFALSYRVYALLGEPSRFLYYFMLKQPMVLADIGVALILAKIILLSGNAGSARTAFLVWLYLPLGIIISSMWGQLDSISLFLALLAIYYVLISKWLASAVTLGLSIYLKTLPLVFLPLFLMQTRTSRTKLGYSLASLVIPVAGTIVPVLLFNWSYHAIYNNFSFQAVIPSTGEMSAIGVLYSALSLPSSAHTVTGLIWVPVLLVTYVYIWRRNPPLIYGLTVVILAFSISRPFLPEQWSLYPLAFLLVVQTTENMGHFLGLAVSTTAFIIAKNTLLVRFFTPLFAGAFNWDYFVNHQTPYVVFQVPILTLLTVLYFSESFMVVLGRESIVHRVIVFVKPAGVIAKTTYLPHRGQSC